MQTILYFCDKINVVIFMNYLLTFLEGFASFISPCILPLVPIYISYFMGLEENASKVKKALLNSIAFVFGSSIIFILIAILATSLGSWIAGNMIYFKIAFAIILIFCGLDYMELIKISMPNINVSFKFNVGKLNLIKSFIFGILFTISHTPCTGVFLATALALVANEQSILKGIVLMLLYSIGLGIPFIASALLIEKAKKVFEFIKKHYKMFKIISGMILILSAIYLLIS